MGATTTTTMTTITTITMAIMATILHRSIVRLLAAAVPHAVPAHPPRAGRARERLLRELRRADLDRRLAQLPALGPPEPDLAEAA